MLRNCVCLALAQEDGDVNVICGRFQEMYEHSVPPVKERPDSLHEFRDKLNQWEIDAMEKEISLYQNGVKVGEHMRWNITLRWHHVHKNRNFNVKSAPWKVFLHADLAMAMAECWSNRSHGSHRQSPRSTTWGVTEKQRMGFSCWPKFLDLTTSSASIYLLSFWNWTSFPFHFVSLFCSKCQISKLLLASKKNVFDAMQYLFSMNHKTQCHGVIQIHDSNET